MNQEIKKQWVAALRSGAYEQTDGYLHNPATESFCCLGVLCDLYALEIEGGKWVEIGVEGEELPAHKVVAWAGLGENDPMVTIDGLSAKLSNHNDGLTSFLEIADAIEAQL